MGIFYLWSGINTGTSGEIRGASIKRDGVLHDGTRSGYKEGVEKQNHKLREYITKENSSEYPELTKFIKELQSKPIRELIAKMVGNENNFADSYVRLEVLNDTEGFWLKPHCDIPEKLISSLIYVNETGENVSLGTDLYDEDLELKHTVHFGITSDIYFMVLISGMVWKKENKYKLKEEAYN